MAGRRSSETPTDNAGHACPLSVHAYAINEINESLEACMGEFERVDSSAAEHRASPAAVF